MIREENAHYPNCYVDDTNYMTKKMIEVECSSRGNNLVIAGLRQSKKESCKHYLARLQIERVKIERVYRADGSQANNKKE